MLMFDTKQLSSSQDEIKRRKKNRMS